VTVKRGKGGSRLQIVQAVADHIAATTKPYDKKYVIFDTERLDSRESRKDLEDALNLAIQNDIGTRLSNPSFEVWFLAHFIRTCKQFSDADAVIIELNKYWRKAFQSEYCKSDPSLYNKLKSRTPMGIQNARLVREVDHQGKELTASCNSATDIYLLVEYLVTPKTE
jgi:RloB-like protein